MLKACAALALVFTAGLSASAYEYRAGVAMSGSVKALALEDRQGTRAVIVQTESDITRPVSDVAAAQLIKTYNLERGAILFIGAGGMPSQPAAQPKDLVAAATAALLALEPAVLRFAGGLLVVQQGDRAAVALSREGLNFNPAGWREGAAAVPVKSPIRAALKMVELPRGLRRRGEEPPLYPIQAIALGKQAAILALGGRPPVEEFQKPGWIVIPFANDDSPFPDDLLTREAIRQTRSRVGR